MELLALCLVAYLAGSVNFSILAFMLAGRGDPRHLFSGNPGTVNTFRALGPGWALGVLCFDLGRGALVALAAQGLFNTPWALVLGSLAVLLGNFYPAFHDFRGGKGVATALGVYLVVDPIAALLVGGGWILIVYLGRRASVGSLLAMIAYPIILAARDAPDWKVAFAAAVAAVIIYRHWANVKRLFSGKEPLVRR
jgi:glycerol-3-phosphate acyltransferase PlsY